MHRIICPTDLSNFFCPPLVSKLEYLFEGNRLESYCSRIISTKIIANNDQCENWISNYCKNIVQNNDETRLNIQSF